jgi:hypothetical protein
MNYLVKVLLMFSLCLVPTLVKAVECTQCRTPTFDFRAFSTSFSNRLGWSSPRIILRNLRSD